MSLIIPNGSTPPPQPDPENLPQLHSAPPGEGTRAARPVAQRNFEGVMQFVNGRAATFRIEARTLAGATAKLAGIIDEQPVPAAGIALKEVRQSVIEAATRMPRGR